MTALEWELAWIDQNVDRYDSPLHAESVKRNIEKRYQINELERKLKLHERKLDKPWD